MDPFLACLILLWLIRRAVEDGWAGIQGKTSPRIERRRAQHELAQKRRTDLGRPTLGQAMAGRVVQRIAAPPERGPARRYFAGLWADSWDDATNTHREKRAKRDRARSAEPQAEVVDAVLCPECGLRWVTPPWEVCKGCEVDRAQQAQPDPAPADVDHDPSTCPECAPLWRATMADAARGAHDRDREDPYVDIDPYPGPYPDVAPDTGCDPATCPECSGEPDCGPPTEPIYTGTPTSDIPTRPEPDPAPVNLTKGTPMTAPTTISGDTVSPLENLGYADACQAFNAEVKVKLDTIANNLAGAGLGQGFVQIVRDVAAAADAYDQGLGQSKTVYARHVRLQAELAGDDDLVATLDGTYLARATV